MHAFRIPVFFGLLIALGAALLLGFDQQGQRKRELRNQLDALRQQERGLERLRREIDALAAGAPSDAELHDLHNRLNSLDEARRELEELSRQPALVEPPAFKPPPARTARWKNAGGATPDAALETVIWSAMNGQIESLASFLDFDQESRAKVEAAYLGLPEALRSEHQSPESFFAMLVAAGMSLTLSDFNTVSDTLLAPDRRMVKVRLEYGARNSREVDFRFRREAEGWRLMVPSEVVAFFEQRIDLLRRIPGAH